MRVLVSGASGFIGRHVARALLDRGDEVVAICRPGRATATQSIIDRSLEVVEDPGSVATLAVDLAACRIDAILHLAARLDPEPGLNELDAVVEANIGFPTRLVAAAAAAVPGSVFVTLGTVWEYADSEGSGIPSVYAATKRAFGEVLAFYVGEGDLDTRTIILPWVYGPEQPQGAIVPLFINALVTGEPFDATSGIGVLDLLHIDDVAAGLLRALKPDLGPGRWMLSSGAGLRVREIADRLGQLAHRPVPVRWGALPDRSFLISHLLRPAPLLRGWSPSVSIDDGFRRLLVDAEVLSP